MATAASDVAILRSSMDLPTLGSPDIRHDLQLQSDLSAPDDDLVALHVTDEMSNHCCVTGLALSATPRIVCTTSGHSQTNPATPCGEFKIDCNTQPAASMPGNPEQHTAPEQQGHSLTPAASALAVALSASLKLHLTDKDVCWCTNKISAE